ncbi:MAG: class I SAM-dependent methyltransferase [Blastocatellia bacterium]|nr:class I SAM-dependent methyltransferase [Blastocatellia bacterium]
MPDQEDWELRKRNADPALLTERLRELVPLLSFVGGRVERAAPEETTLVVPLLETAMNQNGTQQASVFYLIADYTLGVAMWATLPGTYTTGVHDRCHATPIQFWLKKGRVEHLAPGTGEIRASVSLSPEQIAEMRGQLIAKGRHTLAGIVNIFQGDTLVARAEHEMGVYVNFSRTAEVRPTAPQVENIKLSSLMIAALRGDPVSQRLAGEQGIAIAQRMVRASPQLKLLVEARTKHLRRLLAESQSEIAQVLVLGVGLDSKPVEFAREKQAWYLADLREMLRERNRRLSVLGVDVKNCIEIPVDLRRSDWPEKILESGFDPTKPTLIILEGVSMYLEIDEVRSTFERVRALMDNPASRFWIDHFTEEFFDLELRELSDFLANIARLGEPFLTGFQDAAALSPGKGWTVVEHVTAAEELGLRDDVYHEYRLSVLSMQAGTVRNLVRGAC